MSLLDGSWNDLSRHTSDGREVLVAGMIPLSLLPFLMGLAVSGAAAFLTPVATPVNLMVMEPGQYRFGDYTKFGLPFIALFFAVFRVSVVWPFSD